jgi:flagellar biosynthesis component FlhA
MQYRIFNKKNISDIFTYNDSKNILEHVWENNQVLVEDCYSKFRPIEVKNILNIILKKEKNLLNIVKILELMIFYSEEKNDVKKIAESIIKEL